MIINLSAFLLCVVLTNGRYLDQGFWRIVINVIMYLPIITVFSTIYTAWCVPENKSSLKFCVHTSYQSIYKLQVFHVRSNKEMTVYKRFIYRDLYMYRNTDRVKHRPHSGSLINHTRQLKNANFKNMFAWPVHARMERQEKQT